MDLRRSSKDLEIGDIDMTEILFFLWSARAW